MPPKCEVHGVAIYRDKPCRECQIDAARRRVLQCESILDVAEAAHRLALAELREMEAAHV